MTDNLRGILLMTAAMAAFALEDVFVKRVSDALPVSQILVVIGAGGAIVFGAWTRAGGGAVLTADLASRPVILRNLAEMTGTVTFVTALTLAPLATVSAILQATPLVVTLGAALIFGERVGWRRWSAIGAGLAGVLMVIRPGMAGFRPDALYAVLAVICLALRDLATRATPARVSSAQLSAWAFAIVMLAGLAMMPFGPDPVPPRPSEIAQLGAALAAGCIGYVSITAAMRVGDVSVVTPFRYARLVFALILAALVFGERPDGWTLAGAAIIIASGLCTLARERRRPARPTPLPTGRAAG